MSYLTAAVDAGKQQLQLVGKAGKHLGRHEQSQSLTIQRPEQTVKDFFRDPGNLSAVLGDIAAVEVTAPDRYRWEFRQGPLSGAGWDCVLVDDDGRMRFVDAGPAGDSNQLIIDFSEAPQRRGTEVTLRVTSPAPAILSGALAFKALYRARALLQTGEIPTLQHNPSARASAR